MMLPLSSYSADYLVGNNDEIINAVGSANSGDTVIIKSGTYTDINIPITADGITLTVQEPNTVFLEGNSGVQIGADNVTVDGLIFQNGKRVRDEPIVSFYTDKADASTYAHNSRLTNTLIDSFNPGYREVNPNFDAKVSDKSKQYNGDEDGCYDAGFWYGVDLKCYTTKEGRPTLVEYPWVNIKGQNNTVDYNHFKNHKAAGVTVQVTRRDTLMGYDNYNDNHTIAFNHFDTRYASIWDGSEETYGIYGAGEEAVKVGSGGNVRALQEENDGSEFYFSNTTIENNLFTDVSSEGEMVSIKADGNFIRDNTFINCNGAITLRNGDYQTVTGNYIDGMDNYKSGGIRVFGKGHKVKYNHLTQTQKTGIVLYGGCDLDDQNDVNNPDCWSSKDVIQYRLTQDVNIIGNTIVNSEPSMIIGFKTDDTMIKAPRNVKIKDNVVSGDGAGLLFSDPEEEIINIDVDTTTFTNNTFFGSATSVAEELSNQNKTFVETEISTAPVTVVPAANKLTANDVGRYVGDTGCGDDCPPPPVDVVILSVTNDSYVKRGNPDDNWGGTGKLEMKEGSGIHDGDRYIVLKYDIGELDGKTVKSAKLNFYASTIDGKSVKFKFKPLTTNQWTEDDITFNTFSTLGLEPSAGSMTIANADYVWYEFDVTDLVNAKEGKLSLAIMGAEDSTSYLYIRSKEYTDDNGYSDYGSFLDVEF